MLFIFFLIKVLQILNGSKGHQQSKSVLDSVYLCRFTIKGNNYTPWHCTKVAFLLNEHLNDYTQGVLYCCIF